MIRLVGSDPAARSAALAGLNRSFPKWGDERQFAWCYLRKSDPVPADVLIHECDGLAAAGLSLVYRRIARDDEPAELVAIYSGAWTDPQFRGRGLFGNLLDRGAEIAASRGATIALSFVSGERDSLGPLLARSSRLVEAAIFTRSQKHAQEQPGGWSPAISGPLPDLARAFAERRDQVGKIRIQHCPDTWRDQFVERPRDCVTIECRNGIDLILANFGGQSAVLDMLPSGLGLLSEASGFAGDLSYFTTDLSEQANAAVADWTFTKSRFIQAFLGKTRYSEGLWHVAGGDRM